MAKAPEKTCPSLYRLIEHTEPSDFVGFLSQDEFKRLRWLERYSGADAPDRSALEDLLREKKKTRLEPLEREAARVIVVSEQRGQYALRGLVQSKMKAEDQEAFKQPKDDLCRSLWAYLNHRLLFDAVESVIHLRLYRSYAKHYQSFQPDTSVERQVTDFGNVRDALIAEIEARLDMGEGCRIERFDIPAEANEPAAEMYIIYHPNPLTSAREIRDDGERRTIYFRPPGEATVVFTPSTGTIQVRADTKVIRRDVAESFAQVVLEQNLSNKPLSFREYDLSRFFDSFSLSCPELDNFHIESAGVIRAEISIWHLGNRLSLATTINEDIDDLIDRQPGLRAIFQRAVAIRFIEIAVRYTCSGETTERTLDFTISDQNSCSLLSLPDERERILGHRLLRHWKILRELRQSDETEEKVILPVLLEIWNSGLDELTGSWLQQRGIEETLLTSTGFLEPAGWEDLDLIDDDDVGLADGKVYTEKKENREQAYLKPAEGQEIAAGDVDRYRKFRVDQNWMIEHLRSVLAGSLNAPLVETLSTDLTSLGGMEIDGSTVPVYLARKLDDPRVLADSDHVLRSRSNLGIGLVLCAEKEPFRCLAANVLSSVADHLESLDQTATISADTLRTAYRNNRMLAQGGQAVVLVWDGGEAGELFVPGKGSIQIRGQNRLEIIDRLVKAHLNGPQPLATGDLIKGFGGQQLPNIFGNALWKRLNGHFIRSPDRGLWEIAA